jgi:hypothetical protein
MGNFRVKVIKFGRPVATKDRFPTATDAPDGKVLAWSHRRHKWESHFIEALVAWPLAYPYWRKVQP